MELVVASFSTQYVAFTTLLLLFNIYSLISPQQQPNNQLERMMILIPLLVFHLVQAFGTIKGFFT